MHYYRRMAILVLLTFVFIQPAAAWDEVGHKITGYIAWQRMSPAARDNVIKVLRAAPEDSHLSAFYMNYGVSPDEVRQLEYFMLVPTWADIVRDREFPIRFKNYHRSNWHYADTFWRQIDGKAQIITDRKGDGQGLVKLIEFDKVMRDPAVSASEKAIALAWFLHIGGDLHQPLHTSGRHTDREPEGDRGGNLFLLTPESTPREQQENLHWFWDNIVPRNLPMTPADQSERRYLEFVSNAMMHRYPFDALKDSLKLGDLAAWRQETFELAPVAVFTPDLVRFETPSAEYRRNAFRVAERQLTLAGYRMGETLEQIFGNPQQ